MYIDENMTEEYVDNEYDSTKTSNGTQSTVTAGAVVPEAILENVIDDDDDDGGGGGGGGGR